MTRALAEAVKSSRSAVASNMTDSVIRVVAGVLSEGDKFLITQRHNDEGGLWEFPGGKVEAGESEPEALIRELREELGVDVEIGEFALETLHHYPTKSILLRSYYCRKGSGDIQLNCHQAMAWVTKNSLDDYTFSDADKPLVKLLQS